MNETGSGSLMQGDIKETPLVFISGARIIKKKVCI